MTLYEQELQKMIRGIPFIQRYTLVGKAILGSLDKDLRFKISFVTTGIARHYDALKIRVINRTEGEVDGQIFKFKDILSNGRNLVIDEDSTGPSWGLNKPLLSDYAKINQCLHNYLSYYAPEHEESHKLNGKDTSNMNFYEKELRSMFERDDTITEKQFAGRVLLGSLGDKLLVKISFVPFWTGNHYNALQVVLLNRAKGFVDKENFLFRDLIGPQNWNGSEDVEPQIWEYGGEPAWLIPITDSQRQTIADAVLGYLRLFQGGKECAPC